MDLYEKYIDESRGYEELDKLRKTLSNLSTPVLNSLAASIQNGIRQETKKTITSDVLLKVIKGIVEGRY